MPQVCQGFFTILLLQISSIKNIKKRPADYIHCQRHHIVPRIWFYRNNFPVDNSEQNIIILRIDEHLTMHVLLRDYFSEIGNMQMSCAMSYAIDKLTGGNKDFLIKRMNSEEEYEYFKRIREENQRHKSQALSFALKTYYANETQEQKTARIEKEKDFVRNLTPEQRKERRQKIIDYYANETPEQKAIRSKRNRQAWNNISIEKRNEISNKIRAAMNSWSDDFKKNKADRALATRRLNESHMTKDELEIKKKQRSNIHKQFWLNMSEQQRKIHINKMVAGKMNRPDELKRITSEKLSKHMSMTLKNQIHMSNDTTHHHTRINKNKTELIADMLRNGYVQGDHTQLWKKQGYVSNGKGYYIKSK